MRNPFILVLVAGLAVAGFAVWLLKGYMNENAAALAAAREVAGQNVPLVRVYAAGEALRYGATLQEEKVTSILWPEHAVPEGAFIEDEDKLFPEGGEPRLVMRAVDEGEIILASKITEPGGEVGITSMLKPGTRAFSINVNAQSGVSGLLRPGDMVDVFWTGDLQGTEVTRLVRPSVQIIAVDQSSDMDTERKAVANTVSVMTTPEEAAGLMHAQSTGRLTLSLVGVNETSEAELVQIDRNKLFGIQEVVAEAPAPEPERCYINTRKGGELVRVEIACTN